MEGNCTANADVCLLGALSITILLREAHTLAMEPLLARVALNHKQEAVVSSPADAVLFSCRKLDYPLLSVYWRKCQMG